MYWLLALDAVARIVLAIVFLFAIVPALAWRRPQSATLLERFFWNFGVGIAGLTLAGQILSLANLFSVVTLLALAGAVILIGRARRAGVSPLQLVRRGSEGSFLALLNIFDRRVHVARRIRRALRRARARVRATVAGLGVVEMLSWSLLTLVAAALRLYRPFASANLGYSDTYVHMYLLKLLDDGRQVDPAFGPYPRGMHFLLLAIQQLTNVDPILLMNFFGAIVGVLITLAVADSTRRLTKSVAAGVLAGFLFATLVGGPRQYFVAGGAFSSTDAATAAPLRDVPYDELARGRSEFDLALIDFQRQTSTLSQELAIALLFPTALFLFAFFRTRRTWDLAGFAGGTAAIAAIHSGVVVPLAFMSAAALAASAVERSLTWVGLRRAMVWGVSALVIGSLWAVAFVAYPYAGGKSHTSMETSVASAVLYYFPFLRSVSGHVEPATAAARVYVTWTPFLLACAVVAFLLALRVLRGRDEPAGSRLWISLVFLFFLFIHLSSLLGVPQILEPARNSQWLFMAMTAILGIAVVDGGRWLEHRHLLRGRAAMAAVIAPAALVWATRVPLPTDPQVRNRIVNYSGYGGSALAALRIARDFEPYTWTLVSYGQEFPMVLRKGFHIPASSFLEQYDPNAPVLPIPTPRVFLLVEKTAHPFQINAWAQTYSRSDLEKRLQTWAYVYQSSHHNIRVFLEDENIRVYQIERSAEELKQLNAGGTTR